MGYNSGINQIDISNGNTPRQTGAETNSVTGTNLFHPFG